MIPINFSNYTNGQVMGTFNQTCILNQYEMLKNTTQLPQIALWLSLLVFIILGINYIILPFLKSFKHYELLKEALPGMAFAVSIWIPLILMYFTLNLNEQGIKTLEGWLKVAVGILILFTIYFYRKKIIGWFKSIQSNGSQ
jgi:hypothetical protein